MLSNRKISTLQQVLEHRKGEKQCLVEEVDRMVKSIKEQQQETKSLQSKEKITKAAENKIWDRMFASDEYADLDQHFQGDKGEVDEGPPSDLWFTH